MRQRHLNIIFGVGLIVVIVLLLLHNEKTQQTTEINYDLYRFKSQQLQERIDSLSNEIKAFEQKTDTIKLQILRDETTIKNLDNNGIDSAFAILLQSTK